MRNKLLRLFFVFIIIIAVTGFLFPPKINNHIVDTQYNFDGSKTYIYEDGRMYEGEIDTKLNRQVHGTLYLKDRVVIGKFENNEISKGVIIYDNGDVYEGDIVEFMAHGKGEILYDAGGKYIGDSKFDKPDGKGFIIYPNGVTYKGDFKHGVQHGKGRLTKDGGLIQGEFRYNKYIKYIKSSEF